MVENTIFSGSSQVDSSLIALNSNEPPSSGSATTSATTTLNSSFSGTIGIDLDGTNTAVGGGVTWETTDTYSKTGIAITNNSSSFEDSDAIATWQYVPNPAEVGGSDGLCQDLGLRNLADLAHEVFTPDQAFVYVINPSFTGKTLKINTQVTVQMRNSYVEGCNLFGCSCREGEQNVPVEAVPSYNFTHSITIPQAPEGPAGDNTCSDGVDNDKDGNTDSADNQC